MNNFINQSIVYSRCGEQGTAQNLRKIWKKNTQLKYLAQRIFFSRYSFFYFICVVFQLKISVEKVKRNKILKVCNNIFSFAYVEISNHCYHCWDGKKRATAQNLFYVVRWSEKKTTINFHSVLNVVCMNFCWKWLIYFLMLLLYSWRSKEMEIDFTLIIIIIIIAYIWISFSQEFCNYTQINWIFFRQCGEINRTSAIRIVVAFS